MINKILGKKGLVLPGLNTWVIGKNMSRVTNTDIDERKKYEVTLQNIRERRQIVDKRRPQKFRTFPNPLTRGYTSIQLDGRSLGPPAPVRDGKHEWIYMTTFENLGSPPPPTQSLNF